MPLSMKVQPIDAGTTGDHLLSDVVAVMPVTTPKPVVKSRMRRLFRISFTEKDESSPAPAPNSGEVFEPSSVCLAKMVQNFIEESNEKQQSPAVRRGRNRCNCFNGNNSDRSDADSDADVSEFLKSGELAENISKVIVPLYGDRVDMSEVQSDDRQGGGKKLRLSHEQIAVLEQAFREHSTLNTKQKLALSRQVNLSPRKVEVWFQNRRARTKLKQTEVECDYLKRFCESLREENKKLQREVQYLRGFKLLSAHRHRASMCPSCNSMSSPKKL